MPLILTLDGQAAFAAAAAPGGAPVAFSKLVVGDGNGAVITPLETATELVRQVYEIGVQSISVDGINPNQLNIVATIPNEAGPFVAREVGLESSDGKLLAISDYPETVKSVAAQGVPTAIEVTLGLIVSDTANVTIELSDPLAVTTAREINTEDGIDGGGDLSTNRTHKLAFGSLAAITGANVDNAVDKFALFDDDAGVHKNLSPEEVAIALGVQDKIDAAIGGLPPDQVLGLSTEAETIAGTNTTKATHAAGVKAAIDDALSNVGGGDLVLLQTIDISTPVSSIAIGPLDDSYATYIVQSSNVRIATGGAGTASLYVQASTNEGAFGDGSNQYRSNTNVAYLAGLPAHQSGITNNENLGEVSLFGIGTGGRVSGWGSGGEMHFPGNVHETPYTGNGRISHTTNAATNYDGIHIRSQDYANITAGKFRIYGVKA